MNREQLVNAIQFIESNIELPKYIADIFESVKTGECHSKIIDRFVYDYSINKSIAKIDFLNVILEYIKTLLENNSLTAETTENVRFLKLLFHIEEGDFYFHKKCEIEQFIKLQLGNIYNDYYVSPEETFLKTELQELFDLSFDQMNKYAKNEAIALLQRGISPFDLDLLLTHSEYSSLPSPSLASVHKEI